MIWDQGHTSRSPEGQILCFGCEATHEVHKSKSYVDRMLLFIHLYNFWKNKINGEDRNSLALFLSEIKEKYKTRIWHIFLIWPFQLLLHLWAVYFLYFLSCPKDLLKENNSYYCAVDCKITSRISKINIFLLKKENFLIF